MYWIEEREKIRVLKESSAPKPWSTDPIFQQTYFCNVKREDDKTTRWIRNFLSPYVNDPWFEVNIALSRLLNWIPTLEVCLPYTGDPLVLRHDLESIEGKVFGDAYIVSTNGRAMPKAAYLVDILLPALTAALGPLEAAVGYMGSGCTLAARHGQLMQVYGLGSFMAAQLIADFKNTDHHPLQRAEDWWSWAAPGPGSLRGLSWLEYGSPNRASGRDFLPRIHLFKESIDKRTEISRKLCMQDFQNCLCEYDKYMRVMTGVGRSKRSYRGA